MPDKIRLRFRKSGDLRFVSHHDLMRCFERMLRRADLPYRSSEGFHPKPRLVFALSLPLGVVGCQEVVELELTKELPPEEVRTRLSQHCPPGLDFFHAERVHRKNTAQVKCVSYRVALPEQARQSHDYAALATRLLEQEECWIERTRPELRRINIRPFLQTIRTSSDCLEFDVGVTPQGTARPDELLKLLGLGELYNAGLVVERSKVTLHEDRVPASPQLPLSDSAATATAATAIDGAVNRQGSLNE